VSEQASEEKERLATMADKAWKAFERRAAAYFGGVRCPVLGDDTKADVNHETLYIECKQRKKHSVITLWDSVRQRARKEEKTPVVCLSEKGRPGFWILVHSDDLTKL
jgi:hypothetical protein